jgi:hypothetical protein
MPAKAKSPLPLSLLERLYRFLSPHCSQFNLHYSFLQERYVENLTSTGSTASGTAHLLRQPILLQILENISVFDVGITPQLIVGLLC